ncbi:Por secretion system C-terminal sorting domain-containing protein [Chitinophaga sp. YR627]|uniref:glycosyl hydrolase family 8 n=1 Tax=Chitinophaga sp. YR627 TaxID=1881041 RepID=UPI0008E88055|nr:glycosyl hydrolase family 8 [Chitinophaga sp. YR627]SFO53515.1 Por secretion system C-terminal sorting domain-containing protein [Chitinophaga sp. YR627]
MTKFYSLLVTGTLCVTSLLVEAQNKPFPQAITYPNCIKPNNVTQAAMNTSVASYYDYWKAKYLKNNLSSLPGGYYIRGEISGDAEGFVPLGTSEGHGYGMVITALMAGHDPNAKTIYDGLFKTARAFHSSINNNLMGWVVADATGAQGHFDSATDGDIDIAYSLILAHYQWGSNGSINYLNEAKKMITNGLKAANLTSTNRLNLGDWDAKSALNTRPSDWMLSHLRAFYNETGDAAWLNLINNLYAVYNQFSATYSPSTGLISDFVVKNPPEPAPKNFIDEGPQTNEYNYNACRVPLRVVMDYALYGNSNAYTISNKIATWIIGKTSGNPANVKDGYQLNGTVSGSDPEAVFVAPFVAASVVNSANQSFLNSGWNFLKTAKSGYYSDTYSLLCQLFISGNWWKPEAGTTPPPATGTTLSATKDAYVRNGDYAATAYGSTDPSILSTKLNTATTTGYDRQTYIGFDLSNINGTITSAVLKIYGHLEDNRSANIPIGVFSVANTSWTETGLTWNNKPATGSTALSTTTITDSIARYYSWDITAYINSEKAAGRNAISLALINSSISTPRIVFNSKETGTNAPQLVITTTAAAKQTTAATVTNKPAVTQFSIYPAPFAANANVAFTLKDAGTTAMLIYDINGKQVSTIFREHLAAGSYNRSFSAAHLPGGVYIVKLIHNNESVTKKVIKQ